jgi:hypothetical protein
VPGHLQVIFSGSGVWSFPSGIVLSSIFTKDRAFLPWQLGTLTLSGNVPSPTCLLMRKLKRSDTSH